MPVNVLPIDFDLALTITSAPGQQTTVNPGDEVETKVTIFNQGNVIADFVEITANIPAGMALSTASSIPSSLSYKFKKNEGFLFDDDLPS